MLEVQCHIQERVAYFAALTVRSDDPAQLQYEYLQRQFEVALSALAFAQTTLGQSPVPAYDDGLLARITVFKCCLDSLGGRDAAMYSLQLQHVMPRKTALVEQHLAQI